MISGHHTCTKNDFRTPSSISDSGTLCSLSDFNLFLFLVEKETVITNSSQYPLWRWSNFIYRTWTWFSNLLFIFLILVPWCSTFSLRSLLYLQPFYPDLEISQQDGSLHRKHIHKQRIEYLIFYSMQYLVITFIVLVHTIFNYRGKYSA